MSKERKEGSGAVRSILLTLILAFLLLTGAAYALGYIFFQRHYYPGTVINGFRCDFKDAKYVENLMQEQVSAYVLAVNTMYNGREAITAGDVKLTYQSDGEPAHILAEQDSLHWFNHIGRRKEYSHTHYNACAHARGEFFQRTFVCTDIHRTDGDALSYHNGLCDRCPARVQARERTERYPSLFTPRLQESLPRLAALSS